MTVDFKYLLSKYEGIYYQKYQHKHDFVASFIDKILDKDKTLEIAILYDRQAPVAFAVYEVFSNFYGSMTLYSLSKNYVKSLSKLIYQQGYFKHYLLELIVYEYEDIFCKSFRQFGLIQNQRQRMSIKLPEDAFFDALPTEYFLRPLMKEDLKMTSYLSFLAHQVSRDYYMYPGMNNLENRFDLETLAYSGFYGPLNLDGSVLLCKGEDVLGYCIVVDIDCWGYKQVPWIFDIAIRPEFQGQGLGRVLLQEVLNSFTRTANPIAGLAVTVTNTYAIKLYQGLGFEFSDMFYEFIDTR
eukprot:COSAG01_NODE_2_length_63927_cov_1357.611941_53_plen_297_part_00